MQTVTTLYSAAINAQKRSIQAILEWYTDVDALADTFQSDSIVSIEIERTGEQSKFFGFGISHKATIKLLDKDRELIIEKGDFFKFQAGVDILGEVEYKTFPKFYVTEVKRDEKTNELTITAYDALNNIAGHTTSEILVEAPYTLEDYAKALATFVDGADRGTSQDDMEKPETNIMPKLVGTTNMANDAYDYVEPDYDFQTFTLNGTVKSSSSLTTVSYPISVDKQGADYSVPIRLGPGGKYNFKVKILRGSYDGKIEWELRKSAGSTYAKMDISEEFPVELKDGEYLSFYYIYLDLHAGTILNNLEIQFVLTDKSTPDEIVTGDTTISFENNLEYPEGANLEGTETIREALDDIAEASQTIYFIGSDDLLHFRRLSYNTINKTISKDIYMDLTSGRSHRIQTIVNATQLGDNVSFSSANPGETQYIRDNSFLELREDIADIVYDAVDATEDIIMYECSCEWRGDPALEPGDRLALITKDNEVIYTYLINDTFTYNGGLRQKTEWSFKADESTPSNPTSLGEVLKQTYAKVDKANKEIEIVAGESSANAQEIAALKINTESISASVSKVEEANTDAIASINGELVTLTKKVEATMTSEDVKLEIKSEISNGVDKVTTATGFTFNEEGLTIAKTGSEMTTNIDEDGMSVYRDNEEVLTADNTGVTAYNLKAKTYLIVGENSRFEDFTSTNGEQRTGCFWIGG